MLRAISCSLCSREVWIILNKPRIRKSICALLACIFMTACGNAKNNTQFEFNFNNSQGNDFSKQKSIYTNESKDELILNASLKINQGKVTVEILDSNTSESLSSCSYESNADFDIILKDVQKGQEYIISVKAEQTKNVNLVVSASEKLVQNKEKPSKEKGKS